MWMAVMPLSRATSAAPVAARIAAYGDDSMRSALTNMPPLVRAIVSAPEMSVMWIKVLLYELKMWTIAHLSFLLLLALRICRLLFRLSCLAAAA
jgi:hypothetical protein